MTGRPRPVRAAPAPALSCSVIPLVRHARAVGQRVNGVVRLMDIPVDRGGRAYLVEAGARGGTRRCECRRLGFDRGLLATGAPVRAIPMEVSILD